MFPLSFASGVSSGAAIGCMCWWEQRLQPPVINAPVRVADPIPGNMHAAALTRVAAAGQQPSSPAQHPAALATPAAQHSIQDAGCKLSIGLQPQSHVQCMTIKTEPVQKHTWAMQMWIKFVRNLCGLKPPTRRSQNSRPWKSVLKIRLSEETGGLDAEQEKQARGMRPLGRRKTLATSGEESAGAGCQPKSVIRRRQYVKAEENNDGYPQASAGYESDESIGFPQYIGYTLDGKCGAFRLPQGCKP